MYLYRFFPNRDVAESVCFRGTNATSDDADLDESVDVPTADSGEKRKLRISQTKLEELGLSNVYRGASPKA